MLQNLKPQESKRIQIARNTKPNSPGQEKKLATSNLVEDKFMLSNLHPDAASNSFCEDKNFANKWLKAGWEVRDFDNSWDQRPCNLHGVEVVFQVRDKTSGETTEKQGLLIADDVSSSAIFRLQGQEGEYNNNFIRDLAVNTSRDWVAVDYNITGERYLVRDGLVHDRLFPKEEPIPVQESTAVSRGLVDY